MQPFGHDDLFFVQEAQITYLPKFSKLEFDLLMALGQTERMLE